ncbi:hypothetical protein N0V90_001741 [Kalmusia sp. IMI 367209]|nr:hypothetical protein N0V90_001741 [Kalmusia sp. IMI 367209]
MSHPSVQYQSVYGEPVKTLTGKFLEFSVHVNDTANQYGYWRFSSERQGEDDARAYAAGFRNPEQLLIAVSRGDIGPWDNIKMTWYPGEKDSCRFRRQGTAIQHMTKVAEERRMLGLPHMLAGDLARYPIDPDKRLLAYRKNDLGTAHQHTYQLQGHHIPDLQGGSSEHSLRGNDEDQSPPRPPTPTSILGTRATTDQSLHSSTSQKIEPKVPLVEPRFAPAQTHTLPGITQPTNLPGTDASTSIMDSNTPRIQKQQLPLAGPKHTGNPLSLPNPVKIPTSAQSPQNLSPHASQYVLPSAMPHASFNVPSVSDDQALSAHSRADTVSKLPYRPNTIDIQSPNNTTAVVPRDERRIKDVQIEGTPSLSTYRDLPNLSGVTVGDDKSASGDRRVQSLYQTSGVEHNTMTAILQWDDQRNKFGRGPEQISQQGRSALPPNELEMPEYGVCYDPNDIFITNLMRLDDIVPCIEPLPNLDQISLRNIREQVERFDPELWREHHSPPPPPEPEPESLADQISGFNEIIRNEDSYRNDPILHMVPDSMLWFVWAFRTSPNITCQLVTADGEIYDPGNPLWTDSNDSGDPAAEDEQN